MRSMIHTCASIVCWAFFIVGLAAEGFSIFSLHFAVFGMGSAILSFLYGQEGL